MPIVTETSHYRNQVTRDTEIRAKVASIPGARIVSERETSEIEPAPADHYFDEFSITSDDGETVAFIDIHHIGKTGARKIFPTIIRMTEFSIPQGLRQTDIYSIDDNSTVLAHTNISIVDGNKTETKDTSAERLMPYKVVLSQRALRFPLSAMNRILDIFPSLEQNKSDEITS